MLHVDIMDGHFVPNLTIGPPVVESLRKATRAILDVHLMIEDPDKYAPLFIEAGADQVSVHQEACRHLDRTLRMIRSEGRQGGCGDQSGDSGGHAGRCSGRRRLRSGDERESRVSAASSSSPMRSARCGELAARRKERGLHFPIEIDGGANHRKTLGRL